MSGQDPREERPRNRPFCGRFGRWHAARRVALHRGDRGGRQRPGHAAGLPGRDPGAGGHARGRVRVPDPLRQPRHPHAGRLPQRARGDEPRRADHQRRGARQGLDDHRQRGRLHRPQPQEGGLRRRPARGRLARRLPALPGADDHDDRPRRGGDRRRVHPRRRALEEHVRARARLVDVRPARRSPRSTGWRRSSSRSRRCATPTWPPSARATTSARPPSCWRCTTRSTPRLRRPAPTAT